MSEENDKEIRRHPIKVATQRAGLTLDVLRAWEKRYGAVAPGRTTTNRRLYSDADVERLILLRKATLAGRSIGRVAQLSTEELVALVREDEAAVAQAPRPLPPTGEESSADFHLQACMGAVERMDARSLEAAFSQAAIYLSRPVLIERLMVPLMQRIGDLWGVGSLRVAQEHLASAIVRTFLGNMNGTFEAPDTAPHLIITTPAGQRHEFGALIGVTIAAAQGWRVTYLGPDLPAEEIAATVRQTKAKAVALSVIYPPDDPHLRNELKKLRQLISEEVPLLVGGRAADRGFTNLGDRPPSSLYFIMEMERTRLC
jgi:methanogenic corrinoid protein MtbC1